MNIKAIADKYTLATADRIAQPPPKQVLPEAGNKQVLPEAREKAKPSQAAASPIAHRLSPRNRDILNFLEPCWLSLIATDGPVSLTLFDARTQEIARRIGHNRGVWPVRGVKGGAWRDTATTTWDKNPLMPIRTKIRIWTLRETDRDRLASSTVDLIVDRAKQDGGIEELDHGFHDLGPELDLSFFEMELHALAERLGVPAWDDDALIRWFDSIGRRFDAIKAENPDFRWGERIVAQIAERDLETMRGRR